MVHRKNLTKGRSLQKGEPCLIKDSTLQVRGKFPLAIVETPKESRTGDGIVRSAILRIPPVEGRKEKIISRPLELIAPLEITEVDIPYV